MSVAGAWCGGRTPRDPACAPATIAWTPKDSPPFTRDFGAIVRDRRSVDMHPRCSRRRRDRGEVVPVVVDRKVFAPKEVLRE